MQPGLSKQNFSPNKRIYAAYMPMLRHQREIAISRKRFHNCKQESFETSETEDPLLSARSFVVEHRLHCLPIFHSAFRY